MVSLVNVSKIHSLFLYENVCSYLLENAFRCISQNACTSSVNFHFDQKYNEHVLKVLKCNRLCVCKLDIHNKREKLEN